MIKVIRICEIIRDRCPPSGPEPASKWASFRALETQSQSHGADSDTVMSLEKSFEAKNQGTTTRLFLVAAPAFSRSWVEVRGRAWPTESLEAYDFPFESMNLSGFPMVK